MAEIKVLFFLLLLLGLVPDSINNLNINVKLSGKSRLKTYQQSCLSNADCGYGLSCMSYICKCQSDEYWNNTYCVWKVLLYFTTSNYTTSVINNFNGIRFNIVDDVKVIEKPTYYIYVSSELSNVVVQYNQSGSYVRHMTVRQAFGLETVNNTSIYATTNTPQMYKFDTNLNVINNTVPASATYVQRSGFIRYNPSNGYIYVADVYSHFLNVFDLEYNRIANESLKLNGIALYGIEFYHSESLREDLILVSQTFSKTIAVVKRSNKTIYKTISLGCFPYGILMHQKSGNFLVSCSTGIVQLWFTNGADFFNTGKTISKSFPLGMTSDSNGRLMIASGDASDVTIFTPTL